MFITSDGALFITGAGFDVDEDEEAKFRMRIKKEDRLFIRRIVSLSPCCDVPLHASHGYAFFWPTDLRTHPQQLHYNKKHSDFLVKNFSIFTLWFLLTNTAPRPSSKTVPPTDTKERIVEGGIGVG